ncbi:hypothetical protein YC2023_065526 [Brassica napus]
MPILSLRNYFKYQLAVYGEYKIIKSLSVQLRKNTISVYVSHDIKHPDDEDMTRIYTVGEDMCKQVCNGTVKLRVKEDNTKPDSVPILVFS